REARLEILEVMAGAISEPRTEVSANAPKIVSFQIPVDRIGEVIGPKGKVINTLQAETGADITVDDDGMFGLVTIGAKESSAVDEARRRIYLIVDPPDADIGAVYDGKVVNITKFGAFVNILPGRDGLLHISKIGGGKRIDKVEDVLALGQPVQVRVDDIDPQGKISLSVASGDLSEGGGSGASGGAGGSGGDASLAGRGGATTSRVEGGDRSSSAAPVASFEASFDAEIERELGDLGPAPVSGGGAPGEQGGSSGSERRRRRRR
ncbi:MAG: S1 RNA-binding domain-containing protein, partial [Acidimicrobiales bacterium]